MNNHKPAVKNCFFILLLCFLPAPAAFAQTASAEAPGQGMHPAPEISGDALPAPTVPSGISTNASSSIFPVTPEQIPLTIYLRTATYSHNTHQYMGERTVLTIRTSTLNAMQMDLITGILQLDANTAAASATHAISLDISESQLEQIQNVLSPATHRTAQQTLLFHYLPAARNISHWAVLLGVVFATVMLAIAAYGMVMSHRGSADKVISTVAGLIVLLMAYTIYCLLIANASKNQASIITATVPANASQSSSPLP